MERTFFLTIIILALGQNASAANTVKTDYFFSEIPLTKKFWRTQYDGDGTVDFSAGKIELSPTPAQIPSETHAALVTSKASFPKYGYEIEVKYETSRQLRNQPNPWETFWLFFQYQPGKGNRKRTNYVLVKPNGVEAGKAWNFLDQSFNFTKDSPTLPIGQRNVLRVAVHQKRILFFSNGEYVGLVKRSNLFSQTGNIGLYTEDAKVKIYSVSTRTISSD